MTRQVEAQRGSHDARCGVAVAVVIFTVRREGLSVLLIHRGAAPYAGSWALPGGLLLTGETLREAASRKLLGETGVADVFLEQLYTFDPISGDLGPGAIVAYFALVDAGQVVLQERLSWQPAWFPVAATPDLAFGNSAVVNYALRRLQAKLGYSNVAYSLLPPHFTLTQLQRVFEAILGRELDKRNFRKRVLSLGIVEPTGSLERAGAHRPARLYRFSKREPITF